MDKSISRSERGGKQKGRRIISPSLAFAHQQYDTQFFTLPQEVRNMIYSELFLDTRISHGLRLLLRDGTLIRMVPAPNSLSILRTCRRARDEVGDGWLSQVLFHFEDADTALDKLTSISTEKLSQIRHLRLVEENLQYEGTLQIKLDGDVRRYGLVQVLRLLPGLKLDVLTIRSNQGSHTSATSIGGLIKHGQGWKELQFAVRSSWLLDYACIHDDGKILTWISERPILWVQVMNDRDGSINQPSVEIFRSKKAETSRRCSVLNSAARTRCELPPLKPGQGIDRSRGGNSNQMLPSERGKAFLVVVQRGRGVDYQVKPPSPSIRRWRDVREDHPGQSWAEIRNSSAQQSLLYGLYQLPKIDVYAHGDEYEWPEERHIVNDYEKFSLSQATIRQIEASF